MATVIAQTQAFTCLAVRATVRATHKDTRTSKGPVWPQPKRNHREGDRTRRRAKSFFDEWRERKDRLEDQRRRQLDSIRETVGDVARKEWDVVTTACRDSDDSSDSEDEGFEIERDVFDDVADELDDKTPGASRPDRSRPSRSDKLPEAQKDNERKEKL